MGMAEVERRNVDHWILIGGSGSNKNDASNQYLDALGRNLAPDH